jgi:hypothetical protein
VKKISSLLILFSLLSILSTATPRFYPAPVNMGLKKYGFSYGLSGAISFFKVDTRISDRAVPRVGGGGILKMEFYPSPSVHVQLGLELMSQACSFNTYYFVPGYSLYYDHSYGYTHTLRTLEMYVPLIVRVGLNPEEGNLQTIFYVLGGYAPKVFLGATNNVVENATGKGIGGGSMELTFENHFLAETVGNVMIAGFGCDKRFGFVEKFMTFEILYRYNLSRFYYDIGRNNGNQMLIKNSCITLQVGYRFR